MVTSRNWLTAPHNGPKPNISQFAIIYDKKAANPYIYEARATGCLASLPENDLND